MEGMRRFKKGDKVVCINFLHNPTIFSIVGNKVLTIKGYSSFSFGNQLMFVETDYTFNETRFRLATLLERELADV